MGRMSDSNEMRWTAGALGLLLAVAAGCGDGDGKGGSSSGVPGTKTGAELTDEDTVKLCMWAEGQIGGFEATDEQVCTWASQSFAKTEGECKAFVTQCLAQPDEEPEPDDEADGCESASKDDIGGASCKATVSELEACIRDEIMQLKQTFEGASCANAGKAEEAERSAACKKLETTCPSYFDDEEEDEFTCDGGDTTYSASDKCDDLEDCTDGADEAGCS